MKRKQFFAFQPQYQIDCLKTSTNKASRHPPSHPASSYPPPPCPHPPHPAHPQHLPQRTSLPPPMRPQVAHSEPAGGLEMRLLRCLVSHCCTRGRSRVKCLRNQSRSRDVLDGFGGRLCSSGGTKPCVRRDGRCSPALVGPASQAVCSHSNSTAIANLCHSCAKNSWLDSSKTTARTYCSYSANWCPYYQWTEWSSSWFHSATESHPPRPCSTGWCRHHESSQHPKHRRSPICFS